MAINFGFDQDEWLITPTCEVADGMVFRFMAYSDGTPVDVPLGSYFDGAKLSVKAPAGVTATVAGRYDECVLTLAHDDTDVIAEGDVTVSGPGVEVTVPIKQQAGISDITAAPEGSTVTGIYDLNGRRADGVAPGMYIVRYSDGTARKMAVK